MRGSDHRMHAELESCLVSIGSNGREYSLRVLHTRVTPTTTTRAARQQGSIIATNAQGRHRLPAFADNRGLRLLLGTLLYLAQGFPQGVVFYAIPTWLAANGQSAAVVGAAAAAASLPWAAKFAVGAVMDRYTYLAMGRRRPWLVGSQFLIATAFLTFAILSPAPSATKLVIGLGFLISSLTAVQDVALDAMVIDLTPDSEMGRLNGFMFAGKLFGIAGGMAVAGYFMQYHSISAAMLAMLACFAIPAAAAIAIRERRGEKLLPWTVGEESAAARAAKPDAWWPIVTIALRGFFRRDTLLVVALLVTYGAHQTLFEQGQSLFAVRQLGWGESDLGNLQAINNILVGVGSLLLGGWVIDRFGPGKVALISGALALVVIGGFAMMPGWWHSEAVFSAWVIGSGLPTTLFYLAFLVMAMRASVVEVAATSFALIVATHSLGRTTGGWLLGELDAQGGLAAVFVVSALLILVAGLFPRWASHHAAGAIGPGEEPAAGVLGAVTRD